MNVLRKKTMKIVSLTATMLLLAGIIAGNIAHRPAPAGGCAGTAIDTARQYTINLVRGNPTAPCEAYECGHGYEAQFSADLPAGSWRLKVEATRPTCIALLSACDSVCQQVAVLQRGTIDWKHGDRHTWYFTASSSSPATLVVEVGRYELGPACEQPTYWGPPCGY
jgi:hypothetical protein